MLVDFWKRMKTGSFVHPDDLEQLNLRPGVFMLDRPPGQITGPLKTAPVVACFTNPGYDASDAELVQSSSSSQALLAQLSGTEPYPLQFPSWRRWFIERVGRVHSSESYLARTIAVLNACAYASPNTANISRRFLTGLPSSLQAKRYLHEVLLPAARRGEKFVVICRGAWAWEVDSSIESETVRFAPNPAGGHFGPNLSHAIQEWLRKRERSEA
jgi:hypothetical protein